MHDLRQSETTKPANIANSILWLAKKEGISVTPMKLQKLVYFVYGWYLAIMDERLFTESIKAWKHGPVIDSLYYEFQRFGSNPIDVFATTTEVDCKTGEITGVRHPVVDPERTDLHAIIFAVWKKYKNYTAWQVSNITHEDDSPWYRAVHKGGFFTALDDADIKERSAEGIKKAYDISD